MNKNIFYVLVKNVPLFLSSTMKSKASFLPLLNLNHSTKSIACVCFAEDLTEQAIIAELFLNEEQTLLLLFSILDYEYGNSFNSNIHKYVCFIHQFLCSFQIYSCSFQVIELTF